MASVLSSVRHTLQSALFQSALHLLLPRLCTGCHSPLLSGEKLLCLACDLELPRTGFHADEDNSAVARLAGRFPFVRATAYLHFGEESLTQHLVHALKYKRRAGVGVALGAALGGELRDCNWADGIDLIVPVPLHPKKEAARGFNQSTLIAEGLSDALHIPHEARSLRRIRRTESQTRKTRAERIENVAGAFAVRHPQKLEGKHLLLVDDVLTTGATIEACVQAVLTVPGTRVSVATIAIAGG